MSNIDRPPPDLYKLMVNGVTEYAICLFGTDERVRTWNPGAERILGYSEPDAIGHQASFIFTSEDVKSGAAEREFSTARAVGQSADERWHVRKDGSRFWARGILTALRDGDGQLIGYVKVMRDDTDRKLAAEQVELARHEAERANEAKNQFMAIVSHELRTPLSVILLWSKMIQNNTLGPSQLREALAAIQRSAESQKRLIDDLLDTSRISSGKLRLDLRPADPTAIAQLAFDEIQPAAAAKQITLVQKLASGIGQVKVDPDRLRQILLNLLINAVKFTPEKGQVELKLWTEGETLKYAVIDNGRGIAASLLPRIFDRFTQGDTTQTQSHGGLGLGLHIAKELVDLHGGKLTVESEGEGRGARFLVELPTQLDTAEANVANVKKAASPTKSDGQRLGQAEILLVEDDDQTRRILEKILTTYGGRVTSTISAEQAMEQYKHSRPDLIVSDIGMPETDGYSFIKQLRDWERGSGIASTPAIALTAFTREQDFDRALTAGFHTCLGKPVDVDHLINTCLLAMNKKQS